MRPDTSSHACGAAMRRHWHPATENADVPHESAPDRRGHLARQADTIQLRQRERGKHLVGGIGGQPGEYVVTTPFTDVTKLRQPIDRLLITRCLSHPFAPGANRIANGVHRLVCDVTRDRKA